MSLEPTSPFFWGHPVHILLAGLPEHHPLNMRLHSLRISSHLVAETLQALAGVLQPPLVDEGPEEPGEGGLLLVLDDLRHRAGLGEAGVGPDPGSVVDEGPGQLDTLVQEGHALG